MSIHLFFDLLAYLSSFLTTFFLFKGKFTLSSEKKWEYYSWLIAGFVYGAFIFGTLNNYLSLGFIKIGKSVIGALFGAILAIEIFKKRYGIKGSTGAYFVPSLAIGISIGRIGCFMSGLEDFTYGIAIEVPWSVDFGDGIKRHPVQLYESFAMFAFFLFSLWLLKYKRAFFMQNGFYIFTFYYSAQRFLWEFLKPYAKVAFGLNIFQILAILLMVYAVIYLKLKASKALSIKHKA